MLLVPLIVYELNRTLVRLICPIIIVDNPAGHGVIIWKCTGFVLAVPAPHFLPPSELRS